MQRRDNRGGSRTDATLSSFLVNGRKKETSAPKDVKSNEPIYHTPEEDENLKLAHKYMDAYVDSLVGEIKYRKENAYLVKSLDTLNAELNEIKNELSEIKAQNTELDEIKNELSEIKTQNTELSEIKNALNEIKTQNAELTESIQYLDVMRLTVGRSGRGGLHKFESEEFNRIFYPTETQDEEQGAPPKPTVPPPKPPEPSPPEQPAPPSEAPVVTQAWDDENYKANFLVTNSVPAGSAQEAPAPQPEQPVPEAPAASLIWNETEPEPENESESLLSQLDLAQVMALVEKKPKNKAVTIFSNVLFYACMALLIVGAVTFAQSKDVNKSLFGIRYYYIKSPSMEPVYPVGAVVFTKVTPPEDIEVGDDITIFIGDDQNEAYLTHRVVEITQDSDTGELAFRTKGVNNRSNDPAPYNANLMAGKVVFSIPFLGTVMTFVQSQLILVIGIFVLLLLLSFMLRLLFSKDTPEQTDAQSIAETPELTKKQQKEKLLEKQRMEKIIRKIQASSTAKK